MAEEKAEVTGTGPDRILVLDANILLRAVLGTRVRSLIQRYASEVPMFIPASCVDEVHEYLPSLCAKRHWELEPSLTLLDTLLSLVTVLETGFYADHEGQAKHRIGFRDADDWPVVALALALNASIWTEDTDFFGTGLPTWTTETVEIYLGGDAWTIHDLPPPPYGPAGPGLMAGR